MKQGILSIGVLLVLVAGALPASADELAPNGVYVSLGDSLAAGYQAGDGPVTDDSYTDVLFARVRDDLGLATHVKLGCPGETSTTFLTGGCSGEAAIGGYASGTQFHDALAAIATAGPDLRLITIDLGANDVLACTRDLHGQPTIEACLANVALPTLASNLTYTLAVLQAVAPGVPIVGMNYYNPNLAWVIDDASAPFPGFGELSQGLTVAVNGLLEATYAGAFGGGAVAPVPVADVESAFRTFDEERGLRDVCRFTGMCEQDPFDRYVMTDWSPDPGIQPDIHPTDLGYRQIAWAFTEVMSSAGIV